MWEPRLLATLWAFMACYRGCFTFFFTFYFSTNIIWVHKSIRRWGRGECGTRSRDDMKRIWKLQTKDLEWRRHSWGLVVNVSPRITKKGDISMCGEFFSLKTGISGWILWTWYWRFKLHKLLWISWPSEGLAASPKGLCYVHWQYYHSEAWYSSVHFQSSRKQTAFLLERPYGKWFIWKSLLFIPRIREPLITLWRQAGVNNVKAEGVHTNITVLQRAIYVSCRKQKI
jgi:hypothetical protein